MFHDLVSPSVQHALDLAGITALGGGFLRDLVIGAVPPAAFTGLGYFSAPLVAIALVFFLRPQVERVQGAVHVFDVAGPRLGLGLATAVGVGSWMSLRWTGVCGAVVGAGY